MFSCLVEFNSFKLETICTVLLPHTKYLSVKHNRSQLVISKTDIMDHRVLRFATRGQCSRLLRVRMRLL